MPNQMCFTVHMVYNKHTKFFLNVYTKMLVIFKYTYTFMFKSAYVYGFPLAIQIKTFWNVNREMRVAKPVLTH